MYLYGKNSVFERLKAEPGSVRAIFFEENFSDERITHLAKQARIPTKWLKARDLAKIKRADRLQGIVAEVKAFLYIPFKKLLQCAAKNGYSLICLDSLNDPHNLGSIIRIAACFGGFAVVVPEHGSCEVTDTVMHVASGGENFVPVSRVTNMTTSLLRAKEAGYWIAGAVVSGGEDITKVSLPSPLCLVLGSEGKGIRHGLVKHLDLKITLPMKGAPLSLNVAMASAVLCYEILRQKYSKEK
ncbi:MAG: 23S rRNA (guanosine(2251)-2'-O)-methyltransferase RlmB [Candidatus Omnitrophica bacterium]|nr:23S rRNA (guanosine(2251)-2'-O)-methyltransferase RlmB [Candidatus Omnitrophota bacterium]